MFESLNEEACWRDIYNEWSGSNEGKAEVYDYTFQLNQAFVDVIRALGGNNPIRHLLLAGYCTDAALTCDHMYEIPNDPAKRYDISIHYYTLQHFVL